MRVFLFVTLAALFSGGQGQVEPIAHHVVHIGIDGLRPDCIETAPGGAPNILHRLADEGAWTLTVGRTVGRTLSAQGWSATLTAMPPELTGIKSNWWRPAWLDPPNTTYPDTHLEPVMGNTEPFPTVFSVIETQGPSVETAAFHSWNFFEYLTDVGYPGVVDTIFKCYEDKAFCDEEITRNAALHLDAVLRGAGGVNSSYTFLILASVDTSGHRSAWCDANYADAVAVADEQVGRILDVIDSAGAAEDTLVLLSTDHGGRGRWHGRFQNSDLNIPVFVKGPGIRAGHEFQYKVRNMDLVPTAVRALGLTPSLWWEGAVLVEAFEDGVL